MPASSPFAFQRQRLAASIVAGLAGEGLLDYRAGLFLAAPRRTGKSTFLKEDLIPACREKGWEVVYADLNSQPYEDPSRLIMLEVQAALCKYACHIKKLLTAEDGDQANLPWLRVWERAVEPPPEQLTFVDALSSLHQISGQPVVLMIDEAQQALESEQGHTLLISLKVAYDALALGMQTPALYLVCTGNSRDKLAQLVLNRDYPFLGCEVTPLPFLDEGFAAAFTEHINSKLAPHNLFAAADVMTAFDRVGRRPGLLWKLVSHVALDLGQAADLGRLLTRGGEALHTNYSPNEEIKVEALPRTQQAILLTLVRASAEGRSFSPFVLATRQEVAKLLGKQQVSASSIQKGLSALRNKGLVWRSGRGAYALEDLSMKGWLLEQVIFAEDITRYCNT